MRNPLAKGKHKIHVALPKAQRLESAYILDEVGKHIELSIQRQEDLYTLLVQDLPRGLYIIVLQTQQGQVIHKKLSIF